MPDGGLPPTSTTDRTIEIKESRGRPYEVPFDHIQTFKLSDLAHDSIFESVR